MSQDIQLPTVHARKSIALIALGMGVYFLYLYRVGFGETMETLQSVNLAVFSIGFLLALLGVLCDALAWQKVLNEFDYHVSIRDVFSIYLSSIFLNNLIPSGSFSGETARIYFMEKLADNSRLDQSSATVAASRIITAVPFFMGTIVGLTYMVLMADVPRWALAACSSITIFLVFINLVFVGICFSTSLLERIADGLINGLEWLFRLRVNRKACMGMVRQFNASMVKLTGHKRTILISVFWAFMAWICMNLVAFVTFRSMGVDVPLGAILAVYAVMIFMQMLPLFLPGGVGLVDIVMITLFAAVGVRTHDAVAATILSRLIQLWFLTAAGGLSTAYLAKRVGERAGRAERTEILS
ncbi:MAG: flippase-like domain-containing protein [Methanotrichaceae archaeon]|nr:flippase-like domain-containing protein [Methanotrichaceae archaeon]